VKSIKCRKTRKKAKEKRNINRFSDEGGLVVRHNESDDHLEGEPRVADAFDVEERWVGFLPLFLHPPRRRSCCPRLVGGGSGGQVSSVVDVQGDVAQDGNSHAVVRFEAERHNRRDDEENRDARHYLQHGVIIRQETA